MYFVRAKFTLDFKTNIQAFLCFEIKGKFRFKEIYISFKKVSIFQDSLPSKLFLTLHENREKGEGLRNIQSIGR